jgi:hypothetical protein
MALIRKQVGDAERYEGRRLVARFMGPDLLAYVNDVELASFYINVESAIAAGRRYVDDEIKEAAKRAAKQG